MVHNYYEILGLDDTATLKEIASAYRSQALKYHPDKNISSSNVTERFHALSQAYQVLMDPDSKKAYDAMLSTNRAEKERIARLDVRRKTMRDDLVRRERQARDTKSKEREEIIRLQKDFEKQRQEGFISRSSEPSEPTSSHLERTLSILLSKDYPDDKLYDVLTTYGTIESFLVRGRRILVRFQTLETALTVLTACFSGNIKGVMHANSIDEEKIKATPARHKGFTVTQQENTKLEDYENIVLSKLYKKAIDQNGT